MRAIAFLSAATLLSIATFAACGGSDSTTIGVPSGDGGAGEGSVNGDGASSAEGGGMTTDAGGSTTNEGGGGTVDGGPGPGGNTTMIPCGTTSCNIPAEQCCVNQGGGGAPDTYTCATGSCFGNVDGGADGGKGGGGDVTGLGCTSQANCAAGSICCIKDNGQGVITSSCVVGTTCGQSSAQLCDPNASMTGCPASGQNSMCSSNNISEWGLSPPFATCGGRGN